MIFSSPINGEIKLTKNWRGQPSVWVGGFEQSGSIYVEKLWRDGLKKINLIPKNILILGLGCGTVVKIISELWPSAKIVGVELDPKMIMIGKKYFNISHYSNLKIVHSDAREYIKSSKAKFDLILIDAYLGNKQVKLPVTSTGTIITNQLTGITNKLVIQ